MAKQLLDLNSSPDLDYIKIDGQDYSLADPGGFTLVEAARLQRLGKTLEALAAQADVDEEAATQADAALREAFHMIAPSVPDEVAAKLSAAKKSQVLRAFFLTAAASGSGQTGTSHSSPASSDTTEQAQANG